MAKDNFFSLTSNARLGFAAGLYGFEPNFLLQRREIVLILMPVPFLSKLARILRQEVVGDCVKARRMALSSLREVLRGLLIFLMSL